MVMPMQTPGMQMQGPAPPEAAGAIKNLKRSVVGMLGMCAGRLFFAMAQGLLGVDLFGILDMLMGGVIGIWLLKDDEHFEKYHKMMAGGPCAQCEQQGMGGMQCLMPFMMITAMNLVFDVLLRISTVGIMPYGLFLLGSCVTQGAAVYFAYETYKIIRDLSLPEGNVEMGSGRGGFVQQGDNSAPTQPQAWVPFEGSGNRLGD
mmetsp:Transcript_46612/g.75691  ORF Transcript_46612/g.75691 Transcript_46612/m.75691 type:complete len:203 (+) Transcript_46612:102-710(+)